MVDKHSVELSTLGVVGFLVAHCTSRGSLKLSELTSFPQQKASGLVMDTGTRLLSSGVAPLVRPEALVRTEHRTGCI